MAQPIWDIVHSHNPRWPLLEHWNFKVRALNMCFFQALSVEDMIDNVKQIVRQVITSKDKTTPTQSGLEVNILQFFYGYLQRAPENQLINVRSSLVSLMKEGLQLNFPPALFLLLVILRCYVQNIPLQEDKKVRKELQVNNRIQ